MGPSHACAWLGKATTRGPVSWGRGALTSDHEERLPNAQHDPRHDALEQALDSLLHQQTVSC